MIQENNNEIDVRALVMRLLKNWYWFLVCFILSGAFCVYRYFSQTPLFAVDANIMQIHQSIADHLYAHYGIEPRPADAVLAMHYADGREEMQFHYDSSPADRQVNSKYMVTTTKQGDIIDIHASR
jgi:hypothetical protein